MTPTTHYDENVLGRNQSKALHTSDRRTGEQKGVRQIVEHTSQDSAPAKKNNKTPPQIFNQAPPNPRTFWLGEGKNQFQKVLKSV